MQDRASTLVATSLITQRPTRSIRSSCRSCRISSTRSSSSSYLSAWCVRYHADEAVCELAAIRTDSLSRSLRRVAYAPSPASARPPSTSTGSSLAAMSPSVIRSTAISARCSPRSATALRRASPSSWTRPTAQVRALPPPQRADKTIGVERSRLIQLADELDVPVRAVVFDGDTQPGSAISMTQLALCVVIDSLSAHLAQPQQHLRGPRAARRTRAASALP